VADPNKDDCCPACGETECIYVELEEDDISPFGFSPGTLTVEVLVYTCQCGFEWTDLQAEDIKDRRLALFYSEIETFVREVGFDSLAEHNQLDEKVEDEHEIGFGT
jgi:hypothetical protein